MSDSFVVKSSFEEMPVLKFSDAIRFFEAVTPAGSCFACGTDTWDISARDGDISLCFLHPAGGKLNGRTAYNLNIDCRNCGLVRMHRAEVVIAWVAAHPAPVEDPHE